jgi:hypothetical protein
MKFRTGLISLLVVALMAPAIAQNAGKQVTAFVNVNVIPMDRDRVLKDQTVVVRDGHIAELGPANKVKVPAGAARVDGRGKFLIPGLFDMHTHLFSDGKFPDSLAGDELKIMLANGVTTIRFMIGTPEHLKMRAQVEKGELLGPTMYVASPETEKDARRDRAALPGSVRRGEMILKRFSIGYSGITNHGDHGDA